MRALLRLIFSAVFACACTHGALAQGAVLSGTPYTPYHAPMYVGSGQQGSQPVVIDSGPAGFASGLGMSEGLYVARCNNPIAGICASAGTGPQGANWCDYDTPNGPTNAGGYHYLCLSPNARGGGLIAYGAGGAAGQLPLQFLINGTIYQFPFVLSGVGGPSTSVIGDVACWNSTAGTLLSDCGGPFVQNISNTYANPTGGTVSSDSYDCLAATWSGGTSTHGPCLTPLAAIKAAYKFVGGGGTVVVNLSAGTFTTSSGPIFTQNPMPGVGPVNFLSIIGAGSSSTTINDTTSSECGAVVVSGGAQVFLQGMTIQKSSGCNGAGSDLFIQNNGIVELGPDIVLGAAGASGQLIHIEAHGMLESSNPFTIAGSASEAFAASNQANLEFDGIVITCSGSLAFPNGFVALADNATLNFQTSSFSGCGSVTGPRYHIASNSTLDAGGQTGTTLFPGNSVGLVEQTGWYSPPFGVSLNNCTNGTASAGDTVYQGSVSFSGSASTCSIAFVQQYANAPICTTSANVAIGTTTTSPSTLTVTASFVNTTVLNYICTGNPY